MRCTVESESFSNRRHQILELLREFHIFGIVDRTVDDRHCIIGQCLFEDRYGIAGALDWLTCSAEAVGGLLSLLAGPSKN